MDLFAEMDAMHARMRHHMRSVFGPTGGLMLEDQSRRGEDGDDVFALMDEFMADAFSPMALRRSRSSSRRPRGGRALAMPSVFSGLDSGDFMTDIDALERGGLGGGGGGGRGGVSQATVMSYSSVRDRDGRVHTRAARRETKRMGDMVETHVRTMDSRKGVEEAHARAIGGRERLLRRRVRSDGVELERRDSRRNLLEDEIHDFDREWESRSRAVRSRSELEPLMPARRRALPAPSRSRRRHRRHRNRRSLRGEAEFTTPAHVMRVHSPVPSEGQQSVQIEELPEGEELEPGAEPTFVDSDVEAEMDARQARKSSRRRRRHRNA